MNRNDTHTHAHQNLQCTAKVVTRENLRALNTANTKNQTLNVNKLKNQKLEKKTIVSKRDQKKFIKAEFS